MPRTNLFGRAPHTSIVMAGPAEGRVPAIHGFACLAKAWMAATSAAMTKESSVRQLSSAAPHDA